MTKVRDFANIASGLTATATELNYCDGVTSNIQTQINSNSSIVLQQITTYTSSGTWTKPAGCSYVLVKLCGGGGAGGYSEKWIDVSAISSETVTVGGQGGTSSFGSHLSATGGANGSAGQNSSTLGGAGGAGTGGDINLNGGDGQTGTGAIYGDGGAGSGSCSGGASYFGGGGRGGNTYYSTTSNSNGAAGKAYGSGGGGSGYYGAGAAGKGGIVIVYEYGS